MDNKVNQILRPFLGGIAVTAAVFCLITGTLLTANWLLLIRTPRIRGATFPGGLY